jgi:hypothetical protein
MRRSVSLCMALGMVVVVAAPTEAAVHKAKIHRPLTATQPAPQRVCDWVGPGGRAIYRCTTVQPQQQAYVDPPHHGCDWVGPGGRAIYVCR